MRCKFIILLFMVSSLVSAQINYRNSSWYIKGNASSLIDIFSFPTVQLSVEKQFSEYISLCAEGGYQLYSFSRSDTSFLNPTGFKANLEFRYYLSKFITTRLSNKLGRVYTGIRPFYWQTRYNASVSYQTNLGPSRWYDDDFGVKDRTFGLGIVLGFQKNITERLILDLHTGVASYEQVC